MGPALRGRIRRVAGVGFKAIELIAWNRDFLKDYYTMPRSTICKKELKNAGIALSQFVSTPHDLSHADKAKRAAAVEHWKKAVEVGAELGSPIINMVSSHPFAMRDTQEIPRITTKPLVQKYPRKGVPRGVDWDQNFKDYVDALRECAEACEAGRRDDVGRAASRPLPRQPRRRAPPARARRPPSGGHQLRPEPHVPGRRLSEHHGLSARQAASSTCTCPTMTA